MILTLKIVYLILGIILFMIANIISGSYIAWADGEFDKETMKKGIKKAIFVLGILLCIYLAGILNPDIIAFDVDGTTVNIVTALYMGTITTFIAYGKQSLTKLFNIVNSNVGK